jgi:hypothetical protein
MHRSFQQSLEDPANALVYLGEIKEAIAKQMGGEHAAKRALPSKAWSILGAIANDVPIVESRHRGRHFPNLRPASPDELRQARGAAKELIDRYAATLSTSGAT